MMLLRRRWAGPRRVVVAAAAFFLGGCSLAPVYHAPTIGVPTDAWKDSPWQPAKPADGMSHGNWWRIYGDPILDELEARIEQTNPTLAVALARYDQAAAYVGQTRSGAFPQRRWG